LMASKMTLCPHPSRRPLHLEVHPALYLAHRPILCVGIPAAADWAGFNLDGGGKGPSPEEVGKR
jgi:hypothetical protein